VSDVDARLAAALEELRVERAARLRAEQANLSKDRFLAAVSHELRAPITTILLWERILRDPSSSPMLQDRAMDAIHQSTETQARLVEELLDVSRALSGKLHIDLVAVDLDRVIEDALLAVRSLALAKGIALERDGEPACGHVIGDASRLRQIFDNLLVNAIKFTAGPGRVAISTTGDDETVRIEIADTGRGIAVGRLSNLFEPFNQPDDLMTRQAGGLGLGLAISRELATLHHGTLTARSGGEGSGSTFTLTLPASSRDALRPAQRRHDQLLQHVRVLVIDDDERVCDVLALLLSQAGAIVETATSAAAARAKLADGRPQALVCDLAMPDEDGFTFLQALRTAGSQIPAIALTAHATATDIARARTAGFEVHLAKPIDFAKLVENIDQLVAAAA
jgi:CheY-like chemotaxis protein/nitrogen-specific signal transduction histidine kinase